VYFLEVKRLLLHNFRNYTHQEIELSSGINVLFGSNGAGKTNLIEGVYYLSTGRSFRGARDKELVRWNSDGFYVFADVEVYGEVKRFAVKYPLNGRKQVTINGKRPARFYSGESWFNAVVFSPQDLMMIKGPPSARRTFLDALVSRLSTRYARALWEYNRALYQRNTLLKSRERRENYYVVWEDKLAQTGSFLMTERKRFLLSVMSNAARHFSTLTGGEENVSVDYISSFDNCATLAESDVKGVKEDLLRALSRNRVKEQRIGSTVVGPHRDEIVFLVNGKDVRSYGSQGQQRSVALSLRLAEVSLLTGVTGEPPVLLLDDVTSELDELRKRQLLGHIFFDSQVLMTTTSVNDVLLWLGASPREGQQPFCSFEVLPGLEGPTIRPV
jgi:DNA replication and repair protein RecF